PGGKRVPAHTHPRDELATVIRGTWYLGVGKRFDPAKLKAYPAGSFIMIPAGVPHFVATKEGPVVVQLNGTGKWDTHYIEKRKCRAMRAFGVRTSTARGARAGGKHPSIVFCEPTSDLSLQ